MIISFTNTINLLTRCKGGLGKEQVRIIVNLTWGAITYNFPFRPTAFEIFLYSMEFKYSLHQNMERKSRENKEYVQRLKIYSSEIFQWNNSTAYVTRSNLPVFPFNLSQVDPNSSLNS